MSLPVPVLDDPHWRVNFRPEAYDRELIPSLSACIQIIEETKVRLRGWDYPHYSHRQTERGQGSNWVASWSDFQARREYWRLYQSGQFLHLFSIEEVTNPGWRTQLEGIAKGNLGRPHPQDFDWSKVRGFISILNFLYTITEIFEFAARLCQKGIYRGSLTISIELNRISGFLLVSEWNRPLWNPYLAAEEILKNSWDVDATELIAGSAQESLDAVVWFFERFGWLRPPSETLRNDQENFLKGRM